MNDQGQMQNQKGQETRQEVEDKTDSGTTKINKIKQETQTNSMTKYTVCALPYSFTFCRLACIPSALSVNRLRNRMLSVQQLLFCLKKKQTPPLSPLERTLSLRSQRDNGLASMTLSS